MKDVLYATALRYEAVAEFFRRMRDESRENTERARRLLTRRVAQ